MIFHPTRPHFLDGRRCVTLHRANDEPAFLDLIVLGVKQFYNLFLKIKILLKLILLRGSDDHNLGDTTNLLPSMIGKLASERPQRALCKNATILT